MISRAYKTLLMISYPFPPLGAAGSLRPYRFAKYLPEFSWKPIVLTIKERDDVPKDYTLLKHFPEEVSVIRTKTFDPYLLYQTRKGNNSKLAKNLIGGRIIQKKDDKTEDKKQDVFTLNMVKKYLSSLVTTPDHQIFWFPFAVIKGYSLIKKYGVSALFTTSPPHSSHLIGLALKKIFDIPWVADFRDPWVENFKLRDGVPFLQFAAERRLEKIVIDYADRVVANTFINRKKLIERYPYLSEEKFITIHNGFEKINIDRKKSLKKFTIVHIGIFYSMVKPYFFFRAINKWLNTSGKVFRDNIQVLLVGDNNDTTREMVKKLHIEDIVQFIDRLPQREAIEIASASDLLLISLGFDTRNSGWVPMKLYDYLFCNKPIFAFLPNGEAARIIRETKSGYVISSEDFDMTLNILEEEYKRKFNSASKIPKFRPDYDKIGFYETKFLASKLAEILCEVAP